MDGKRNSQTNEPNNKKQTKSNVCWQSDDWYHSVRRSSKAPISSERLHPCFLGCLCCSVLQFHLRFVSTVPVMGVFGGSSSVSLCITWIHILCDVQRLVQFWTKEVPYGCHVQRGFHNFNSLFIFDFFALFLRRRRGRSERWRVAETSRMAVKPNARCVHVSGGRGGVNWQRLLSPSSLHLSSSKSRCQHLLNTQPPGTLGEHVLKKKKKKGKREKQIFETSAFWPKRQVHHLVWQARINIPTWNRIE